VVQGNQMPVQSPRDILGFMRKNEASFPHIRNSATYKLFELPPCVREQKASKWILVLILGVYGSKITVH